MNRFTVTFFPETGRGPIEEFRGEKLMVSVDANFILIAPNGDSSEVEFLHGNMVKSAVFENDIEE